jgi:hypothetical protein
VSRDTVQPWISSRARARLEAIAWELMLLGPDLSSAESKRRLLDAYALGFQAGRMGAGWLA